jgi:hypothetical protein
VPMAHKIIERVDAHYEAREVPFGTVYEWHPAYVALECYCGEQLILTATSPKTVCRCGADVGGFVNDVQEREGRVPDRLTLEKRKAGQLANSLGEALPGEPSAALERLADEDRRQAEVGLVALMSMGKVSYKHLDELSPKDMPARIAANRLRMTWLKERRDGWLARSSSGRT